MARAALNDGAYEAALARGSSMSDDEVDVLTGVADAVSPAEPIS